MLGRYPRATASRPVGDFPLLGFQSVNVCGASGFFYRRFWSTAPIGFTLGFGAREDLFHDFTLLRGYIARVEFLSKALLELPAPADRNVFAYLFQGLAHFGAGEDGVEAGSLVLFGDYVSYYLAILYQVDPSPVKAIDFLKERLAREKEERRSAD